MPPIKMWHKCFKCRLNLTKHFCMLEKHEKVMGFKHVYPDPLCFLIPQTCFCPDVSSLLKHALHASRSSLHLFCDTFGPSSYGFEKFRKHFLGQHDTNILEPVCISTRLAECGRHQKSSAALSPEGKQQLVAPIVFGAVIRLGLTYQRLV